MNKLINGISFPMTPEEILAIQPTLEESILSKKEKLRVKSFEVEVAGVDVNGLIVDTSRMSQQILNGASVHSGKNPTKEFSFPGKTGWAKVNKTQLDAVIHIVAEHVSDTFDNEMFHSLEIDKLTTVEEVESYDINTGW